MTKEEIIAQIPMNQVLAERSIQIRRNGMISCPFHGTDKKPSMKIYKDGYRCFACGEYGNVIDFVMKYDNVDFKTAFVSLGGTYSTSTLQEKINAEIQRKEVALKKNETDKKAMQRKELAYLISLCREGVRILSPISEEYAIFYNNLQVLLYYWEKIYIEGEGVNVNELLGLCRRVRQEVSTVTGCT